MAVLIFFFGRKFCERFFQGREEKDRIVSKSAVSASGWQYLACGPRCNHGQCAILPYEGIRATEMRRAFNAGQAVHLAEQLLDSLLACCADTRMSRRENARAPSKARYHQPGIIRNHNIAGLPRVVERLAQRIFRKRWC